MYDNVVTQLLLEKFSEPSIQEDIAIVDGYTNDQLTYRSLHNNTYEFANALRKQGVKKGDCVAIISPNHLHYFTAFHGIALTGAFSTTVNPAYTEDEIEYQIGITHAKIIVAHPLCLEKSLKVAVKLGIKVISLGKAQESGVVQGVDSSAVYLAALDDFIANENMNDIDIDSFIGGDENSFDSNNSILTIPFSRFGSRLDGILYSPFNY